MARDHVQSEVARARRQLIAISASAVSVVVLVGAMAFGADASRDTAVRSSAALGSLSPAPVGSFDSPLASAPPATAVVAVDSPTPIDSSAAASSLSVSVSARPTPTRSPASSGGGRSDPEVSLRISPTRVMLGEQIRVTVTILNAGRGYAPPAEAGIGSMIPSDTFDQAPKGCTFLDGGVDCPIVGLRPGQKTSLVFTVTPGWFPGGSGSDNIFGMLCDPAGQPLVPQYSGQVWVDDGTASLAPPASGAPSSSTPSAFS